MTAVAGGPQDLTVRILRKAYEIPTKDGNSIRIVDTFQQYRHGRWQNVDIVTERIEIPMEDRIMTEGA